ncbi:hypothetical protein NM688_g8034 [Phlebia brevispora]|uniref:Uncharacterized protein n=1 Tax=Phlebia brevispora TaxID=194682 RepID=A0ACC1RY74_9APHY|nr:hypothetical protein NM688_g8034 [Phlebia brevispora]
MLTTLVPLTALFSFAAVGLQHASAQIVVNGQIFTNGLAIVDAPQPGTTLHAGATQSVAIDISGDGHLPSSASTPGSSDSTRFDSLEVYLISYTNSFNLTVSSGSGLLTQEAGSTVKHIDWLIDPCIQSGNYNLTFYEGSHINGTPYFTITPLPIEIQNTSPSSTCANGTNPIQAYPQAQSAPDQSPWLNSDNTTSNVTYPSVGAGVSTRSPVFAMAASALCAVSVVFAFL